jgi:hypothetical protein
MQSASWYTIYLRSVLILSSSRLRLDLSNGLFSLGFPTKMLFLFVICPVHANGLPSHPRSGGVQISKLLHMWFPILLLRPLSYPNILLSTLFSNTLGSWNQVNHFTVVAITKLHASRPRKDFTLQEYIFKSCQKIAQFCNDSNRPTYLQPQKK